MGVLAYIVPLDDESCILNGVTRHLFQRGWFEAHTFRRILELK
jgi:hypothetical protein